MGCCRFTAYHLTILVDEKFGKVPFDIIAQRSSPILLRLHPFPKRVGVFAIDVAFLENVALEVVSGGKGDNFFTGAWLLLSKLVTWKC
jgi:hypothetical protein